MILRYAEIDNAKRRRLDKTSDDISSIESKLRINLKRIQDLLDLSFQVKNTFLLGFVFKFQKNI